MTRSNIWQFDEYTWTLIPNGKHAIVIDTLYIYIYIKHVSMFCLNEREMLVIIYALLYPLYAIDMHTTFSQNTSW